MTNRAASEVKRSEIERAVCEKFGDYCESALKLIEKESSFNPYAVNPYSGATGLCQSLPASKMATHGSDYLTNVDTQLAWCYDYIQNRYKNASLAWAFWLRNRWF